MRSSRTQECRTCRAWFASCSAHVRALQRTGQPLQRVGCSSCSETFDMNESLNLSEPIDSLTSLISTSTRWSPMSHRHLQPVRPRRGLCGQAVIGSRGGTVRSSS